MAFAGTCGVLFAFSTLMFWLPLYGMKAGIVFVVIGFLLAIKQ
jgi:hypothetical protein